MTQRGWEYHEEYMRHDAPWDDELNVLGAAGWELVAVLHDESEREFKALQSRVIFKRPRGYEEDADEPADDEPEEELEDGEDEIEADDE